PRGDHRDVVMVKTGPELGDDAAPAGRAGQRPEVGLDGHTIPTFGIPALFRRKSGRLGTPAGTISARRRLMADRVPGRGLCKTPRNSSRPSGLEKAGASP